MSPFVAKHGVRKRVCKLKWSITLRYNNMMKVGEEDAALFVSFVSSILGSFKPLI